MTTLETQQPATTSVGGSATQDQPAQPKPQFQLDWTLHDLLKIDGGNPEEMAFVMSAVPPIHPVSSSLPESKKYTWQAPGRKELDKDMYARICLGNAAQNHGIVTGPTHLVLFDIDPSEYEVANDLVASSSVAQADAARTFSILPPNQRPRLSFVTDADKFEAPSGTVVSAYPPMDFIDKQPCFMPQEELYKLLAKRELAISGLPTPHTEVIDSTLTPAEARDETKVAAETERIIQDIRARSFPYVIKFTLAVAGQGVFVVRNEKDLADAEKLGRFDVEIPKMIRSVREDNAELHPASICIQAVVEGEHTRNLSFMVTKTGQAVFMSCCEQFLDEHGIWRGSIIDYERQNELEKQYRGIMDQAATFVNSRGFYGPMGADVMTDSEGKQFIVDLNVRMTGDIAMGAAKGFFYERRGMRYSYIITPLVVLGPRDLFEHKFQQEIADGSLVIIGWSSGRGGLFGKHPYSVGSVLLGANDKSVLTALVDKVNAIGYSK